MKFAALAAAAMLAAAPAQAGHLTAESIAKVLDQANGLTNIKTRHVPAGLPRGGALFGERPAWAVLAMCAEHSAGNGADPGTPRLVLTDALEKRRKLFLFQAANLFSIEQDLPNPTEALLPVSGWGTEFATVMEAEAKAGRWSYAETEDACRILGGALIKVARPPS